MALGAEHSVPSFSKVALQHQVDIVDAGSDESPSGSWRHPPSFYCPISQQCMHDPVVLADGHSYERQYIKRWLEHHDTSPVSGLKLPQKTMYPNHALRNAIEEYFQQVFSAHRRAIRQSITSPASEQSLGTNTPLLRTIDALMQCSLLVNADLSVECVLRRIMDEAKTLVGAEVASVFLVDEVRQELYSTVNSTGLVIRVPVTNGIAGHVATSGEPVLIHDAYSDARFNKSVDVKTGFRTRNIMCVPLKVKRGRVIGVVQLINKCSPSAFSSEGGGVANCDASNNDFTADDLHFVQVFASQAATAIGNAEVSEDPQLRPENKLDSEEIFSESMVCRKPSVKGFDSPYMMNGVSSLRPESKFTSQDWDEEPSSSCGLCAGFAQECDLNFPISDEKALECSANNSFCNPGSSAGTCDLESMKKRRSGRARQRAAKYWSKVRVRTPSP